MNKHEIKTKLDAYVARMGSQNKAAATLKGVSSATITQIKQGHWDSIADKMWRKIAAQMGFNYWVKVDTRCSKLITQVFADAQVYSHTHALTAEAGSGKSFTAADYVTNTHNAYHITCCEWWGPQAFFAEILRIMGMRAKICNNDNSAMIESIVAALKQQERPLLILDEADKLHNKVLYNFISLYNQLEDVCGIVLMATDNLERRIKAGVRRNLRGYNEVYSRLGRRFIAINANNAADVAIVCQANGVEEQETIDKIISDCDMDLRRVKRFIHSYKILQDGQSN